MKLTAQQVYDKLINKDKILSVKGQIKFYLGDVDIIVKQKDVVGNIMQEWLEGWFKKNKIEFKLNHNTQMPPDFYLDPDNMKSDLLEVKAFNKEKSPGFDIADFKSFQHEIINKPYMLHTKYLIFGYQMSDDGYVHIKQLWLEDVWNICRRMEKWPLNLQIKENVVHKIRPAVWYSNAKSIKFLPFTSLEDFISAVEQTVFQNPSTKNDSGTWLNDFKASYKALYGKKLNIPRWSEIEDKYRKK